MAASHDGARSPEVLYAPPFHMILLQRLQHDDGREEERLVIVAGSVQLEDISGFFRDEVMELRELVHLRTDGELVVNPRVSHRDICLGEVRIDEIHAVLNTEVMSDARLRGIIGMLLEHPREYETFTSVVGSLLRDRAICQEEFDRLDRETRIVKGEAY